MNEVWLQVAAFLARNWLTLTIALLALAAFFALMAWRHLVKYSLKRLGASVLTLLIIITVVFILLRNMPEEGFIENYDKLSKQQRLNKLKTLGLTDPITKQFWNFLKALFHGNLGTSTKYSIGRSVTEIIVEKAPISIKLGLMSMALSLFMGIPLGAAMARAKGKFWDKFGTAFIVFISAVPAAVYYIFIQLYGTKYMGIFLSFLTALIAIILAFAVGKPLGSAILRKESKF